MEQRGEDPTKHAESHGDFEEALKGLIDEPGAKHKHLSIHSPAPEVITNAWLNNLIPGIHKLEATYHVGNWVATARGPNPPKVFESMPLYVRLGMQALYHGRRQAQLLASERVSKLLREQSIKQGKAFDSTDNVLEHIQAFVKTYQIDCAELEKPNIADYKTFNEFFYRKLRPNARPVDSPSDPSIISSAADCRLTVYPTVEKAKEFWIKGANFTLTSLLQDESLATSFHEQGASLAIFRLAPADYHRYHSPVTCLVGPTKNIEGDYYTVNPVAVNENLDVFTENKRDVTLLSVPQAADATPLSVAFVAIGAMLVGSIQGTVQQGQEVGRGDELGYFAYGGSTVVAVFPAGKVQWDEDLIINSSVPIETAVRVGEQIGKFV
ncbi:phosphatidylserine decarboxylase-domain-containing protein [Leucosporidium creatinivorum]|uniref:phosphatidylserine decarboxylase n=1 Tax=Leucosporidium creatinivorum TaxID=106004 RepID=A0A1Y2EMX0_9BASI|nr:phosphatidylserine decarboxylase-domain-containing protein [Leucosporidium creatinivorum]